MTTKTGPGSDALDAAVAKHFPGVKPFVTYVFHADGKPPFECVKAWKDAERRFIFMMSYGLSELYEKTSPSSFASGVGHEFTLRVPYTETWEEPHWGVKLLERTALVTLDKGNQLSETEPVFFGQPIVEAPPTGLNAVFFNKDVALGHGIDTPHGYVTFLQVVGVTMEEATMLTFTPGSRHPLTDKLGPSNPHFLTILDRHG